MPSRSAPEFGLALQNYVAAGESLPAKKLVETAVRAEDLGFSSIWVWDHLLLGSQNYFPILESLSVLTAVAARTEKVKLGTGILVLPLRNPIEVAKRAATIDDLSGGRLILGVSSGWYDREFSASGIPFKSRARILEEDIEIMKRLWTERRVSGTYGTHELKNVTMEPKPLFQIPVWLGGYGEKAHDRVARVGDGWVSYFYTPESFQNSWKGITERAKELGRDPSKLGNCNMIPVRLGSSKEAERQILKSFVAKYCDLPKYSEATVDSGIAGNREDCLSAVELEAESGVQNLVAMPAVRRLSEITEQVERFAAEIIRSY